MRINNLKDELKEHGILLDIVLLGFRKRWYLNSYNTDKTLSPQDKVNLLKAISSLEEHIAVLCKKHRVNLG
jgi:hypothetical protein